jgi:hypothetical protein
MVYGNAEWSVTTNSLGEFPLVTTITGRVHIALFSAVIQEATKHIIIAAQIVLLIPAISWIHLKAHLGVEHNMRTSLIVS